MARYAPADAVERGFVEEMISCHWRMRRTWAMESATVDRALKIPPCEPNVSAWGNAATVLASSPEFALLNRYESRLQANFQRALNNLMRTREAFLRTEPETAVEPLPAPQSPPKTLQKLPDPPAQPPPPPAMPQNGQSDPPERPDDRRPDLSQLRH